MKIALIQLPHFYGDGLSRLPSSYPLGLGYISNCLADAGIGHEAIDLWGMQYSVDEALDKAGFAGFDFFGISAYATQYKYLKELSLRLKGRYPNVPIICGGAGPTFSHGIILKKTGVDVCVLREGELTIVDLLQNFDRLDTVKGVAVLKDGGITATPPRKAVTDLDSLGFPNRELFAFEKILDSAAFERSHRVSSATRDVPRRTADILAGRGCAYSCNYCSKTFEGMRLRSIGGVVEEIAGLKERYGVNHLQFNDELLLVNKKRTLQLCEELKRLDVTWSCQGRINQVDREILTAMKDAGCIEVGYGVESVTQSILDAMNKRLKAELIVPAIKLTQEIGITPIIQYMYGYPGENAKTVDATIRFFEEIDHPFISFTTTPIPGTRLYQDCLQKGLIKDEEDYLLRLDSGYNLAGGLLNMTEMGDAEFLAQRRRLHFAATHNYLKKRPLEYGSYALGVAGRRIKRAIKARLSGPGKR
ncbi:MAG: cobalamin B12-binding domain-containing protein [Deltaproteobacteria bacterium]|nr:cobalamin B12-binding domain-containing protein [Deltaproteobacteria bacterium]